MSINISSRLIHFIVALLFLVVAIGITYPLIFHIGDYTSGYGDELILSYIQNYVAHAFMTHPLSIFNAPSYFPFLNSLAYSDSLITSSLLFLIPASFFHSPIAFHNLTLLFSLASLGWSVYFLTEYLSKQQITSFLTGLAVIFSPVILDKYIHLQVIFLLFLPLSVYFLFRFFETKKTRFVCLSMLCFVFQTLNSFLTGFFVIFALVIVVLSYSIKKRGKISIFFSKKNIGIMLLSFIVLIPFILPYLQVSHQFSYSRDIRDAIHFANQPEDFFYTNQFSKLADFFDQIWKRSSYPATVSFKNGFPGIALSILFAISARYLITKWKKVDYKIWSLIGIAITGFVLSLGPFLHINRHTIHHPFPIPLPYAVFYYIIPGFNGMRNSARWEVLGIVMGGVLLGVILSYYLDKLSSIKKLLISGMLLGLIIAEFVPSIGWQKISRPESFPQEYKYLSQLGDVKVVEMPVYNWNVFPYSGQEYLRQYYSLVSMKQRLNGVSGFSPPPWQDLVNNLLVSFPDDLSLKRLKNIGITTIIVHPKEYSMLANNRFIIKDRIVPDGDEILAKLDNSQKVKKLKTFPTAVIYQLK